MAGELYAFDDGALVAFGDGALKSDCPEGCCEGAGPEYLLLIPCSACDDNALANTYMIPEGLFVEATPVVKYDGDCYEVGEKVAGLTIVQPASYHATCSDCCPSGCDACVSANTCTNCSASDTPTDYTVEISSVTLCACWTKFIFPGLHAHSAVSSSINNTHVLEQDGVNFCLWKRTIANGYTFKEADPISGAACAGLGADISADLIIELEKATANNYTLTVYADTSGVMSLGVDVVLYFDVVLNPLGTNECCGDFASSNDYVVGDCGTTTGGGNYKTAHGGAASIEPCDTT